jgi:hypothetical protein
VRHAAGSRLLLLRHWQYAHDWITVERGDPGASRFSRDATVDYDDCCRITDAAHDFLLQIIQRVLGLGEDQDFAPQTRNRIEDERIIEDRLQLAPFSILTRQFEPPDRGFVLRWPRLPRPEPRPSHQDRIRADREHG